MNRVTKGYADGTRALDDVSLSLVRGLTYVLGPTGAGKSTLLNIIGARERPDQGTVCFGDTDGTVSPALLRKLAAYVPTDSRVPPPVPVQVALEHFAALHEPFIPRLRRARVEAQLRLVDLWDARSLRVGELTPAMQWRLMVAIALLDSPQLLLLDVPSHELDAAEFLALLDLVEHTADHRIVILATSNAHLIRDRCAQIVLLARGRVLRDGAADRCIDEFRGRVWEAHITPDAVPYMTHRHCVLSTQRVGDSVTLVVFADEQPGAGFVAIEPDLTHVYGYDLTVST
ncbi:ATP-binding cassette domain-containing protein [Gemmatimonas sp.]|uniref:ATP-binding cassette domain-containing protein n=1 Tax=Gemmatimonas sp. TaxID=1962908 RepID=UPI00286E8C23|nr:ATP-binding cassette domain-containing protein [Gemmatimonas sp.]